MTDERQNDILKDSLLEYFEEKKKLEAFRAEFKKWSKQLKAISEQLENDPRRIADTETTYTSICEYLQKLPNISKQYGELSHQHADKARSLQEQGISLDNA